jgi:hypothetical protein
LKPSASCFVISEIAASKQPPSEVWTWSVTPVASASAAAIPVGSAVWPFFALFAAKSARLDLPALPLSVGRRSPRRLPAELAPAAVRGPVHLEHRRTRARVLVDAEGERGSFRRGGVAEVGLGELGARRELCGELLLAGPALVDRERGLREPGAAARRRCSGADGRQILEEGDRPVAGSDEGVEVAVAVEVGEGGRGFVSDVGEGLATGGAKAGLW